MQYVIDVILLKCVREEEKLNEADIFECIWADRRMPVMHNYRNECSLIKWKYMIKSNCCIQNDFVREEESWIDFAKKQWDSHV